jgi:hypothetical protein
LRFALSDVEYQTVSPGGAAGHRAGIRAVERQLAAIGGDHVGKKPFVTFNQGGCNGGSNCINFPYQTDNVPAPCSVRPRLKLDS